MASSMAATKVAPALATPACTLAGHKGAVNAACFNADGSYCMSAGDDRKICLWNPHREPAEDGAPPAPIKEYTAHNQRVLGVTIATDNSSFASCGGDRSVFVWDVLSGRVLRRLAGHEHRVNAVCYNPDCTVLLSASYDRTVRCWDMRSHGGRPIQTITGSADSVSSLAVSAHEIVSGSIDGHVCVYDLRAGKVARDALGVPVGHVALSHDQQCVLAATLDSTLRLLDKASGQVLCEYAGHENTAFQVGACLSHDDSRVLGGSEDGALHVWGLVDAKPLGRVQCHRAPLVAVSSHPKGDALLTASHDGTCKMWRSGPEGSSGRASDRVI